jgi:hypothetical protein
MNTRTSLALAVIAFSTMAVATGRDVYNQRSADRFVAMFLAADVDRDDTISRADAGSSIELAARFDDVDINRDGIITREELTRFIDASFR